MSETLRLLLWRYAAKKMDATQVVPEEKVDRILEAIRLSASSSGLQPYQVLVITDAETKAKIRAHAWNQSQVTDASHLLVFAAWDHYSAERINLMFDLVNEQRGILNEGWEDLGTSRFFLTFFGFGSLVIGSLVSWFIGLPIGSGACSTACSVGVSSGVSGACSNFDRAIIEAW